MAFPPLKYKLLAIQIIYTLDPNTNTGDGNYVFTLAAGTAQDYHGNATTSAFNASFDVDSTGITISGTAWNNAALPADTIFSTGALAFEATLSEPPFRLASARRGPFTPGVDDVILTNTSLGEGINETSINFDTSTNIFRSEYNLIDEGIYELRLVSGPGAFADEAGNALDGEPLGAATDGTPTGDGVPGGDYVVSFIVDSPPRDVNSFERIAPFGSLMSESASNVGFLHDNVDEDRFLFFAKAGESISAVAGFGTSVTATMEIVGIGGTSTSASPSTELGLSPRVIPADGTYELRITADVATSYDIRLLRNGVMDTVQTDASPTNVFPIDLTAVDLGNGQRFGIDGNSRFSYGFTQTNDPSQFFDISTVGTPLNLADDAEINITTVAGNDAFPAGTHTVGNNGGVIVGPNVNLFFQNLPLPSVIPGTALFPFWDDLTVAFDNVYAGEAFIDGVLSLVVQWEQIPHFDAPGGDITFQLQVPSSGTDLARFIYTDAEFGDPSFDFGGNATIGYQNVDGRAAQHSFNTPSIAMW